MKNRKALSVGVAGLVLGLALGGLTTASAATSATAGTASNPVVAGACDLGLRVGVAVRDSGGRLRDVVAKLTGYTTDEIHTKRLAGTSFAAIGKEKGVSADEIVASALKVRTELLDAKVKDGTITQAQADEAQARMKTRLTDRVNSTQPGGQGKGIGGGMGRGGQGRGMGNGQGRGAGAGGCNGQCTTTGTTATQ
jgi:hypothetical protein